jgi:hypothetical protein
METKILGLVPFFDHLVFQHRYNSLFRCYIEVMVIVRGQASIGGSKGIKLSTLRVAKLTRPIEKAAPYKL